VFAAGAEDAAKKLIIMTKPPASLLEVRWKQYFKVK
jgi:hypothetical protein